LKPTQRIDRHRAGVLPSSGGGIMQQIENWVFFLFISLIRAGSPMFFGTKTVWRVPFVDVQG
jgi:hypothetical protein